MTVVRGFELRVGIAGVPAFPPAERGRSVGPATFQQGAAGTATRETSNREETRL